jgi:hypothetical protein
MSFTVEIIYSINICQAPTACPVVILVWGYISEQSRNLLSDQGERQIENFMCELKTKQSNETDSLAGGSKKPFLRK